MTMSSLFLFKWVVFHTPFTCISQALSTNHYAVGWFANEFNNLVPKFGSVMHSNRY